MPSDSSHLTDQDRLRLMTVLRVLDQMIALIPPNRLELATALRQQVYQPSYNLQLSVGIPLDDLVEIRP